MPFSISKLKRPSKKTFTIKIIIILLIIALPITGISYFYNSLGIVTGTYGEYFSDGIGEYVTEDIFMNSNNSRLAQYAEKYETITDLYHIPQNLTGDGWDYYLPIDVNFKNDPVYNGVLNSSKFMENIDPLNPEDPGMQVDSYGDPGHVAVYSGISAIGDGFRYAAIKREGGDLFNVTERLLKLVIGLSLLSEVTGDGSMARWVLPNTEKARQYFGAGFFEENNGGVHLKYQVNFTGPNGKTYEFWCQTGSSMDCYLGVFNALGMIYAMCDNSTVREISRAAIDRMLEYFTKSGWRFIDEDGKSHSMGSEALTGSPLIDSGYTMNFLRIGVTAHPEKWNSLYYKYAHDRLLSRKTGKHASLGMIKLFAWQGGYFNINLAYSIAGPLCFLETEPELKAYYRENWLQVLYDVTKYHRNAWFDVMYYLGMSDADFSSYEASIEVPNTSLLDDESKTLNQKSVGDSLMRLSYRMYPFRRFDWAYNYDSYAEKDHLSPIPNAPYPDVEEYDWKEEIESNNPIVKLTLDLLPFEGVFNQPKPADWRNVDPWLWEGSSFRNAYGFARNILAQSTSGTYTSPYWIARYLNYTTITIV